jgi:FO synthase
MAAPLLQEGLDVPTPVAEPDRATLDRLRSRALHRAEEGRTLKRDEAAALLTSRAEDLDRLLAVAARVRDAAPWLRDRRTVTYSRKVFVPLTNLCRDTCGYCTFAWPPKKELPAFLSPDVVLVDVVEQVQGASLGDPRSRRTVRARSGGCPRVRCRA